ncbi:EB1C [Symbiodinium sp. KB8]|nr:EB1C [Symbiodinium sp. KB8]
MDGAFFVSRTELLAWLNSSFQLSLDKVEQCANGAVWCQIIDACHPGAVSMKRVNWMARDEHQCIPNYKVLQQAFSKVGIQRHIEVDKLVRGKYQDNLEMLQWIKNYFERTFQGTTYNAAARRFTDNVPDWARPSEGSSQPLRRPLPASSANTLASKAPKHGRPVGGDGYQRSQAPNVALLQTSIKELSRPAATRVRFQMGANPSGMLGSKRSSAGYEEAGDVTLTLSTRTILEPSGKHQGTVFCFHGLGDDSRYWEPFFEAMRSVGLALAGLRVVGVDAPRRLVWGERMNAWFEYLTDRSGALEEDEINEAQLLETRRAIQALVQQEVNALSEVWNDDSPRVLLMGSSQGGSVACDAALTSPQRVAGIVMLRSLVLGSTATQQVQKQVPLVATSGDIDDTFALPLVKRNLDSIKQEVEHVVIKGLTHAASYDAEEILAVARFLSRQFGLDLEIADALGHLRSFVAKQDAALKSWGDLSESELMLAARLGIQTAAAWDEGTGKIWEVNWEQLSFLQRQAAQGLGFTPESWNAKDSRISQDPACEKSWAELTEEERAWALKLGVKSRNAWDNGTAPVWAKAWRKLSHAERKAAEQLGFNETSWNGT